MLSSLFSGAAGGFWASVGCVCDGLSFFSEGWALRLRKGEAALSARTAKGKALLNPAARPSVCAATNALRQY
jgi:hypothetical protein